MISGRNETRREREKLYARARALTNTKKMCERRMWRSKTSSRSEYAYCIAHN